VALKGHGFRGCGKTPNELQKGEIWGMQNHQLPLADRSQGILARSIFRTFRESEFFRSLFSRAASAAK
jgi:hypothetical protein